MARRRRPPRPGALAELPPLKILSQIAALQALYYAVALVLMLFTVLVAGSAFSMELIFGWDAVRGDTTQGWLMGFVWILDGGLVMYVSPSMALCLEGLGAGRLGVFGTWLTLFVIQQGRRDSSTGRALQTRARLCALGTRHPPHYRNAVYGAAPTPHGMVALDGGGQCGVGCAGNVGLSLPSAPADHVWRRRCGIDGWR